MCIKDAPTTTAAHPAARAARTPTRRQDALRRRGREPRRQRRRLVVKPELAAAALAAAAACVGRRDEVPDGLHGPGVGQRDAQAHVPARRHPVARLQHHRLHRDPVEGGRRRQEEAERMGRVGSRDREAGVGGEGEGGC